MGSHGEHTHEGGEQTTSCEQELVARFSRYARAALELGEVRRCHRKLKTTRHFKHHASQWTRHTGRQAVPELLVAAIRGGDRHAEDVVAAPTNELLRTSRYGIDTDRSQLVDVAAAVDWLTGQFGASVVALWASNFAWHWTDSLYVTLPALLTHPDFAALADDFNDLDGRDDNPCVAAVVAARDAFAQLRNTGAAPDPWGRLRLSDWRDVVDQLRLTADLDPAALDGGAVGLQDDLPGTLVGLVHHAAGDLDDEDNDLDNTLGDDRVIDAADVAAVAGQDDEAAAAAADHETEEPGPSDRGPVAAALAAVVSDRPLAHLFTGVTGLADAELARQLAAAADVADVAVAAVVDHLSAGHAPPAAAVELLAAVHVLSQEASDRLGDADVGLDRAVTTLQSPQPDPALTALSQVNAAVPTAEPAAAALRDAATDALARGGDAHVLRDTAAALADGRPPNHTVLSELAGRLGGDPYGIALAVATGALRLPASELDTGPADAPDVVGPSEGAARPDATSPVAAPTDVANTRDDLPAVAGHGLSHDPTAGVTATAALDSPTAGATATHFEPTVSESADDPADELTVEDPTEEPEAEEPGFDATAIVAESTGTGQVAEPACESVADGEPTATTAELDTAFVAALDRSDFGAAHWVAAAAGQTRRAAAAKVAAYAHAMRRDGGPAAAAFDRAIAAADPSEVARDPAARLLLIAAATRATLIRPYLSSPYLDHLTAEIVDQPHTHQLLTAIVDAARAGVSIGTSAPGAVRTGDAFVGLAARAEELLTRGETAKSPYQAATLVWQTWMARDGMIGGLVTAVADDDRARADDIALTVADLRKSGGLDRDVDSTHQPKNRTERIDGRARRWLISNGAEALDLVDEWLDQVRSDKPRTLPYVEQKVARLRGLLDTAQRGRVYAELEAGCSDAAAHAAVRAASRELDLLFDRLLAGEPYMGADTDPAVALSATLLTTKLPLDLDTLEPADRTVPPHVAAILADPPDLAAAFAARADAGDIDEATRILELIGRDDADRAAKLRGLLDTAAPAARHAADEAWQGASRELLTAQRQGWLTPDDARELTRQLEVATITTERQDLGRARRHIDRLRARIHDARDRRIAEHSAHLDELAATDDAVAEHAERIRDAIGRGDLLSADEMLRLIANGTPLACVADADPRFNGRYNAAIDDRTGHTVDAACEQAVRDRGRWGVIDFSELSAEQAATAVDAVAAWRTMAGNRHVAVSADAATLLSRVLQALGLEPASGPDAITRPNVKGGTRHNWWEVRAARTRGAPIPRFGSRAAVWRVLLVWPGMDEATLTQIVADEAQDRPVVVLRFEAVSRTTRGRLAEAVAAKRVSLLHVDVAAFCYRLSQPDELWGTTLWLTLPYTATNPYIRRGQVPPEMFKGRDTELRELLDLDGPAVVYGGRQLGKTALLRRAQDVFASRDDAVAVYLDIYQHPAQEDQRLWAQLHKRLGEADIELPKPRRDVDMADAVRDGLRTWLADDPARRALILLDECDTFLYTDRESGFARVAALKRLMEDSPGRCKIVFAGLHTVQRFANDPNQPFAHLAGAIQVGGLPMQGAYDLIDSPMQALGYRFDDPDTVTRIVAYANYAPAVLQEFGWALVDHLVARRGADGPPWPVTDADVEEVYSSDTLTSVIASKFQLTLTLDEHYKLVANVMALRAHEQDGVRTEWTVDDLRDTCKSYWPQGFADTYVRTDQFRLLLDEMVGLGVLAKTDDGRYALLNANVGLLLGTRAEVEERLLDFVDLVPELGYQADKFRHKVAATVVPSPLTDQQVGTLLKPRDVPRVLLGSAALGAGHIAATLQDRTAPLVSVTFEAKSRPFYVKDGTPMLPDPDRRVHRIVLADIAGRQASQIDRAVERAATLALDPTHPGTATVVVQLSPDQLPAWRRIVIGDLDGAGDLEVVGLKRLDERALQLWADHIEQTLKSTGAVTGVLATTGGWPSLLADAAASVAAGHHTSLDAAAKAVADTLTGRDTAKRFCDDVGLSQLDAAAAGAWHLLTELGTMTVKMFDTLWSEQYGGGLTDQTLIAARRERELLDYLQVVVTGHDGHEPTVGPEPVALTTWRTATGTTGPAGDGAAK